MDLQKYVWLSRVAGQRLDLVQAGGGNTSYKPEPGKMVIKASGGLLADMTDTAGWVTVNNQRVISLLQQEADSPMLRSKEHDAKIAAAVAQTVIYGGKRPSIETFLHALFSKFTLHTHPSSVIALTLRSNWRDLCLQIGEQLGEQVLLVEYATPGISLAQALFAALQEHSGATPKIVFLRNHGLITSAETAEETMALTNVVNVAAASLVGLSVNHAEESDLLHASLQDAGFHTFSVRRSTSDSLAANLCENASLLSVDPCCPDTLIYCGYRVVRMQDATDVLAIRKYCKEFGTYPKVIVIEDRLYFIAQNLCKTLEVEDVFVGHIQTLIGAARTDCALPEEELHYLGNWEAEKYRQNF